MHLLFGGEGGQRDSKELFRFVHSFLFSLDKFFWDNLFIFIHLSLVDRCRTMKNELDANDTCLECSLNRFEINLKTFEI